MLIDPLLVAFVRRLNRHYLKFDAEAAGTRLPSPDPQKLYVLYLHIPFCEVLCPFCSFHRVQFQRARSQRYFEALRREIQHVSSAGYRFREVYIGGGTPTVMPGELTQTIALLRNLHPVERVSVETNPDHLEGDELAMLRSSGVNRLSVGVQSFDDGLLREMGRFEQYGSGSLIRERLHGVKGAFETLNVDMIFNIPHQTRERLKIDLEILTEELCVDQVSFYPLMTANSTQKYIRREMGKVAHRRERDLYRQISAHMQQAGYVRTSAWCFSRTPAMIDEYISENEEYLGLGSGSFSYLGGTLYAATFSINHYLSLVESGATGLIRHRHMNERDQMRYYLLMRLFGGSLGLSAAEARFNDRFSRVLWLDLLGLRLLGAVSKSGDRLTLNKTGAYLWVLMMREFFSGVNRFRDEMRHHISTERITGHLSERKADPKPRE